MSAQPSLKGRALLAVGLMIGFYVLAIGIAMGLLWIAYASVVFTERISIKLVLACVIGSLAIVWSILPRRDKFVAPGPELVPGQHPRLFEQLRSVAAATGQAMPRTVYLVSDVNAWVSERGGVMGFGSQRVMGLGLPLLRVLKISELRAVIAHEFGHYHGGDTRLGPWIYKTRGAIGRTLSNLGDDSWLQMPFLWYSKMFLRITHAVSRQQELAADALAARVGGATALISALRTIHGAALAFNSYWGGEMVPILQAGYVAPMADGFARFLSADAVARSVAQSVDQELREGQGDPYDTHPPLRQRVQALSALSDGKADADEVTAITLLEDVRALERSLLVTIAGGDLASQLKTLEWKDAGSTVYVPIWKKEAGKHAAALSGVTLDQLPALAANLDSLRKHFQKIAERQLPDDELLQFAAAAVGCAVAARLSEKGCELRCEVGMPIVFVCAGGMEITPFSTLAALRSGQLPAAQWREQCVAAGLTGIALGAESPKATAKASPV